MKNHPTYAIVGAGFSGMAVAIQLLRKLPGPARICLINRSLSFGRGLAYGTNSPSHLLNVPAGRMSLDPDQDSGFIDFLQSRGLPYKGGDFVPRSLYGDYLERSLLKAQAGAADGVKLELVEAEVLSIDMEGAGESPTLVLNSGRRIEATEVILALGNFTPRPPATASNAHWNGGPLVNDVWSHGVLERLQPEEHVLLVGTGLTAYDAVLRLLDQGHRGPITMLSRRALLPQPHREQETAPHAGLVAPDFLTGEASVRAQLRRVRALVRDAAKEGHDWRDVIGGLRSHTPRLWQQLSLAGRRQFMRHLMPYWDTHRHRAAPAIYRRIRAAMDAGQLSVQQGRLIDASVEDGRVRVTWRPRGSDRPATATYGVVINCTGPSSDLNRVSDPLIVQLRDAGALAVDELALGLAVDDSYRIVGSAGRSLTHVRYVGPLLKAQLWEATAVPELRTHARKAVENLLSSVA
ncbi:FAD/NAD(P)-binding protein [Caenimonas aquaedulcis]|uniref:FAD/NAD(P)-binding protein n=1 Tax=Caenimonas aquaedulcis TaxID=2793270 RepID=A0A931H482_9BURK|nr:FAD/NAD(P)-binding protein [Caenimonas aquaedulcis]MBG9388193.1 FAD/NAD(P)-binding protein [Caenimonas aquaedulcis]